MITSNDINFSKYEDKPAYNIKAVTQITGINAPTLRAWERRYKVLSPPRSQGNYRLYSDRDLAKIIWLNSKLKAGMSISRAVALLERINKDDEDAKSGDANLVDVPTVSLEDGQPLHSKPTKEFLQTQLHRHLIQMDEKAANQDFFAAMSNLTLDEVCVEIIPAVLIQIGNDWHDGLITIAAEHYATSFLMGKLFSIFNNLQILVPNDISVLVACAQGERHEVGALLLAIFLRKKGYAVRYFGADLPIYDLLEVCRKLKPRILVISAMMKQSITALNDLPERLREYSSETHLVVGGSALSEDNNATHVANGIAKYYGGRTIQAGIATIESLVGYPK